MTKSPPRSSEFQMTFTGQTWMCYVQVGVRHHYATPQALGSASVTGRSYLLQWWMIMINFGVTRALTIILMRVNPYTLCGEPSTGDYYCPYQAPKKCLHVEVVPLQGPSHQPQSPWAFFVKLTSNWKNCWFRTIAWFVACAFVKTKCLLGLVRGS